MDVKKNNSNQTFRQNDIGLKSFDAKQLFLQLLVPTIVVIITVMQLHYCHKRFLQASAVPESSEEQETVEEDSDKEDENFGDTTTESETKKQRIKKLREASTTIYRKLLEFLEITLLFIEIHAYKALTVLLFFLAANSTELLHLPFVVLGVVGLKVKPNVQFMITRIASLIAALLGTLTMVYQFKYIDSSKFESDCAIEPDARPQVTNNAEWIGFKKTGNGATFIDLVRPYLVYIVLVSTHSYIALRQKFMRIKKNKPAETPEVVFENIRRSDVDGDIPQLFKFLVNFGFYKFGNEICLICLVIVIGYRMDLIACFYSIWLVTLFSLKREKARKVWRYAVYTIGASILIQYVSLIGLPPSLCWNYPWQDVKFLQDFSNFAFLPENTLDFKSKSAMLLLDFTLLLFMSLQKKVFKTEAKHDSSEVSHPGESNKSILDDIDQLGIVSFVTQSYDFMETTRNYLDIMKQLVFTIFFWIALTITFLTGTRYGNIFSIGYIIGSFIFLWQGTDFYLKPIKVIVKWWNYLIAYNVAVIATKSLIQLIGCLVLNFEKTKSLCWLIQVSLASKKN